MIDLAATDIRRLREARSCDAAREAWKAFLEHSNRAINRLEGHSKRTDQLPKYKRLLKAEIWASDLPNYMRTARNAHEHGVDDIEASDPYNERAVFADGRIISPPTVIGQNAAGDQFLLPASAPPVVTSNMSFRTVRLGPSVKMGPIRDNEGNYILPPAVTMISEDEPEIVAAARTYLAWIIEKVGTFT